MNGGILGGPLYVSTRYVLGPRKPQAQAAAPENTAGMPEAYRSESSDYSTNEKHLRTRIRGAVTPRTAPLLP